MRPAGEIHQALLRAACELTTATPAGPRGGTLQELAHHANVGLRAARQTVSNLCRRGQLQSIAERRVQYRNRPVAEYAPKTVQTSAEGDGGDAVARVLAAWTR